MDQDTRAMCFALRPLALTVYVWAGTGPLAPTVYVWAGTGPLALTVYVWAGTGPWPRLFSLGPGPARAPLMEAEGYCRSFFSPPGKWAFLLWGEMCFMCFLEKVSFGAGFFTNPG